MTTLTDELLIHHNKNLKTPVTWSERKDQAMEPRKPTQGQEGFMWHRNIGVRQNWMAQATRKIIES